MPFFFSLGLHKSLKSISDRLLNSEEIFAFLDDMHLVCRPNRVAVVYENVRQELQRHTNIDIHCGKTKIWNRSSEKPNGVDQLTVAARVQDPSDCGEGGPGDPSFRARHEGVERAVGTGRLRSQVSGEKCGTPRHSGSKDSLVPDVQPLRRHAGQLICAT